MWLRNLQITCGLRRRHRQANDRKRFRRENLHSAFARSGRFFDVCTELCQSLILIEIYAGNFGINYEPPGLKLGRSRTQAT